MNRKKLVNLSIDYIMQHLDEELSLDSLAEHFYISKFYFCRIFKEETGETIVSFIRRSRIDQSAIDMKVHPVKSITDIAADYGYSSSNYSTLFQKHHIISPKQFRLHRATDRLLNPFAVGQSIQFRTADEYAKQIEIQELNDMYVLYERYIGNYNDIEKHWNLFLNRYSSSLHDTTILIERFFHDPSITEPAKCICDLCMSVEENCHFNNVMRIQGGTWIIYHYDGNISDIYAALQGFFTLWLPKSSYEMSRRYGINVYHHMDFDHHRVVMDLCIPV